MNTAIRRSLTAVASITLAIAFNVALSCMPPRTVEPLSVGRLQSLSFSPNGRFSDPEHGDTPSASDIDRDLAVVADVSNGIRTYTVSGNMSLVPELAEADGLTVSLGVWVDDHDPARTRREMDTAADLAAQWPDVTEVYVGNEALLRNDATAEQLVALMHEMRLRTGKPVSTGETWSDWIAHPELAREADFVAAHVLPYWEGIPADRAASVAFDRYETLRKAFPGKRIVIAEFGWPSGRFNRNAAVSDPGSQAMLVRNFAAEAARRGIGYNLVEAFDQPWKTAEGDVGPYWGIFDASRHAKFPLSGPVDTDPDRPARTATSILLGLILAIPIMVRRRSFGRGLVIAATAQAIGHVATSAAWATLDTYGSLGTWIAFAMGAPFLGVLAVLVLDRGRELADNLASETRDPFPGKAGDSRPPKVSIHVPACNEMPSVVIPTLESLAALDYPDYEVLLVVNNTTNPALVEPVRLACERLGPRFRFIHLPKVSGYKAGALNRASAMTAPDATVIAVVDADYVVSPSWLQDLTPAFDDPRVAIVQAPQEHRNDRVTWMARAMNAEYATFFDVGMVERAHDNAIIAHGTMIMVRRSALEQVGGWGEGFVCEDTELGLRLFEAGWSAAYTNHRYGYGILPDTLDAFRRQRDRWAYGAMRIIASHWRYMLPGSGALTTSQKWHFICGWLHWMGDAAAVTLAIGNAAWATFMILSGLGQPPVATLSLAVAGATVFSITHLFMLHLDRCGRGPVDATLAAIAGASLQLTVARAVASGLVLANLPFRVTAKGGTAKNCLARFSRTYRWEAALGTWLGLTAFLTHAFNNQHVLEVDLFAGVMAIQAIPPLLAVILGMAEAATVGLPYLVDATAGLSARVSGRRRDQGRRIISSATAQALSRT